MPSDAIMSAEEVLLEEGPRESTETCISKRGPREHYIGTPDRPRAEKRRGNPDDMDEDINKNRRINSETEEGERDDDMVSGSPEDQPDTKLRKLDDEMLEIMNDIDRKILAAAILGVDTTEVYPQNGSLRLQRFVVSKRAHLLT